MESTYSPEFKSYSEIDNHYAPDIKEYVEQNRAKEGLWVATEKIHGTNFCFITDGMGVVPAKRTSLLAPTEKFFNFQPMAKLYSPKVAGLFGVLKAKVPDLEELRVFGEFYGGVYPGEESKGKPIQKGIHYSASLDFEAFDLLLKTPQKTFWYPYKEAAVLLEEAGIPAAKILFEGTLGEVFDKAVELDPDKFESQIYLKHGHPKLPNNFIEGFVIKMNEGDEEGRISIKIKGTRSLEVLAQTQAPPPKKKSAPPKELSPEDQALGERVCSYVTLTRIENLYLKLSEHERNEKKLRGMVMGDVWKDFQKEEEKATVARANKLKGQIMKTLNETIQSQVALFLKNQS